MPADGSTIPLRQTCAVRTLFDSSHSYDAGVAGFPAPTEPGVDGGFRVVVDTRHGIPSIVITGSDGEVTVCGFEAMRALTDACSKAEQIVAPMYRAVA